MSWLARVFMAGFLLITEVNISAEGMRGLFDTAGMPLWKTGLWPLTKLKGFAETKKLDIAHVLSVGMLVAVWIAWELIIRFVCSGERFTVGRRIIFASGTLILFCDLVLFWIGISNGALFGEVPAFSATLLTALYAGMLVLAAAIVNWLEGRLR